MNVVLTREVGHNDALRTWLGAGVKVRDVPLTETRFLEHESVAHALASLENYGRFESLVITSARTGEYLDLARAALSKDADVYSVGPATTQILEQRGVTPRAQSPSRALDLAPLILKGPVLFLGAHQTREELADDLMTRGIEISLVACYETVPVQLSEGHAAILRDADVVLIGAPSAWAVARELVKASTWVIVPGVTTGDAVRHDHQRVLEGWGPALGDVVNSLAL